jgi:hypothetical protein
MHAGGLSLFPAEPSGTSPVGKLQGLQVTIVVTSELAMAHLGNPCSAPGVFTWLLDVTGQTKSLPSILCSEPWDKPPDLTEPPFQVIYQ